MRVFLFPVGINGLRLRRLGVKPVNKSTDIDREAFDRAGEMLGFSPDDVERVRPRPGACEPYCYRVRKGTDTTFLKIQRNAQAEPVGLYFHRRLREAGLPVPKLIHLDRGDEHEGRGASIWEYVAGIQAHFPDGSCLLDETECVERLREIHELSFDGPFCFLGDVPSERWFGPASDHWGDMFPFEVAAKEYFD